MVGLELYLQTRLTTNLVAQICAVEGGGALPDSGNAK